MDQSINIPPKASLPFRNLGDESPLRRIVAIVFAIASPIAIALSKMVKSRSLDLHKQNFRVMWLKW